MDAATVLSTSATWTVAPIRSRPPLISASAIDRPRLALW